VKQGLPLASPRAAPPWLAERQTVPIEDMYELSVARNDGPRMQLTSDVSTQNEPAASGAESSKKAQDARA